MKQDPLLYGSTFDLLRAKNSFLSKAEDALQHLEASGSPAAALSYVKSSVSFIDTRVSRVLVETLGEQSTLFRSVFLAVPVEAPVDPWRVFYPGRSLILTYATKLRSVVRMAGVDVEELRPTVELLNGHPAIVTTNYDSFVLKAICDELARVEGSRSAMDEIRDVFHLSDKETATLFGISAEQLASWHEHGIPDDRAADVGRVRDVARRLQSRLRPERIPQIVRTPGKGLGGRTALEVLSTEGADAVHAYLDELYAYRAA